MFEHYRFVDLSHPLDPHVPTWNGSCGFQSEIKLDYDKGLRVQQVKMHAGVGTHLDAPAHFFEGGSDIAGIPLERLIIPAFCLDLSTVAHETYQISRADLLAFEKRYGSIEKGSLFIGYTGWSVRWNKPDLYRNEDSAHRMRFPTFSREAALLLLERDVAGIAIDTLSPDPEASDFPVHKLLLGSGKFIIENIASANRLPPIGAYVICLPLRAVGLTECAIRAVGLLPL